MPDDLNRDERALLDSAYRACAMAGTPAQSGTASAPADDAAEYLAVLEIGQWEKGQAGRPPSSFQLAAGTLVDVAVAWFASRPGAISDAHPQGRALLAFLTGIESVSFATTPPRQLLSAMMVGVLETVAADPRLLAGGQREEALISQVSGALATAVRERFAAGLTSAEEAGAASWAALVARTVLQSGAEAVLADPKLFLDLAPGNTASVVQKVAAGFLDLLLPAGTPGAVDVAGLVSGAGVETMVRTALAAVGEHPGVLGLGDERKAVRTLVADLATSFSHASVPATARAAFPAVVGMVLEKSAARLETLWPGDRADAGHNLALIAVRRTLDAVATAAGGGPLLGRRQMTDLIDEVLELVADNPRWVVTRVGEVEESEALSALVTAVLATLKGQSVATLSGDTLLAVLPAALTASALQRALLDRVPDGVPGAGTPAIDAVFETLDGTDAEAKWSLARASAIEALLEVVLAELGKAPLRRIPPAVLQQVLRDTVTDYAGGTLTLEGLAATLASALLASVH